MHYYSYKFKENCTWTPFDIGNYNCFQTSLFKFDIQNLDISGFNKLTVFSIEFSLEQHKLCKSAESVANFVNNVTRSISLNFCQAFLSAIVTIKSKAVNQRFENLVRQLIIHENGQSVLIFTILFKNYTDKIYDICKINTRHAL